MFAAARLCRSGTRAAGAVFSRPRLFVPLILFAFLVQAFLCLPFAFAGPEGFSLTLLHTNDTHSVYGGFTAEGRLCYLPRCPGGSGGHVRLDQALRAILRERPEALVLDAGDFFQGSLYWMTHKASLAAEIARRFTYLAYVPGNHEFDEGCGPCLELLAGAGAAPLAANLSFEPPLGDEKGAKRLRPWLLHELAGRKIGLVGLVNEETPELSAPCAEARFAEPEPGLVRAVGQLREQGADIIIVLSHLGLERDRRLARSVDGPDVIVGGHSHSLLSNTRAGAEGPYPLVEISPSGRPVLLVTAAARTRYLGRLDVRFDDDGAPESWSGDVISLDEASLKALGAPEPDPELEALIENASRPVRAMLEKPLAEILPPGKNSGFLEDTVRQCRKGECPSGSILADALLAAFPTAGAALVNGGALRHSLPVGRVSVGNVLETLPFPDFCAVGELSGQTLLQALEHGLSAYGEEAGRFLQCAGLRYVFDPQAAKGARLLGAEIAAPGGGWTPVEKEGRYTVATLDYLAGGGDGFSMLRPVAWTKRPQLASDLLRDHLERHSPLRPAPEGRIRCGRTAR